MENFKAEAMCFLGRIYVPKELRENREKKVLHLSDTPSVIFPRIRRLIELVEPDYIIHTGDLSDELKIENKKKLIAEYLRLMPKIVKIMEESSAERVIIALGNQDDETAVRQVCTRSTVMDCSGILELEGVRFQLAHFPEEVQEHPEAFNLYGHNLELSSHREKGQVFLNGVQNIHVITLESKKVFTLRYPGATNDYRYRRKKFGL